jgi:hypothetical protein
MARKRRTAAQIRATKKLVALNKARARGRKAPAKKNRAKCNPRRGGKVAVRRPAQKLKKSTGWLAAKSVKITKSRGRITKVEVRR